MTDEEASQIGMLLGYLNAMISNDFYPSMPRSVMYVRDYWTNVAMNVWDMVR